MARKGISDPTQCKEVSINQQCPPPPPSLPVDRLDAISPIQSPDENQEERRKEEIPYSPSYCSVCTTYEKHCGNQI